MKIGFHTLGCKVNQYETEMLKEKFAKDGHEIVSEKKLEADDSFESIDALVVNTCTVTNLADRKSRQYIRKIKRINPDCIIAVTGCYAQVSPEEVEKIDEVNIIIGTSEKPKIVELIENYSGEKVCQVKDISQCLEFEETGIVSAIEERTRAYVKIQEGCNRFCSYCIIPYARGPIRSRKKETIIEEIENLVKAGYKEVVLTGINTALYGFENGESKDMLPLEEILEEADKLEGDFRIRLSSLEPTVINKNQAVRLLKYKRFCHHLHLSLQSGSDKILKDMNRNYNREDYLDIVKDLRKIDPLFGITADIIVGFPGETENDFEDSVEMVKQAEISKVHGFKYSPRKGTPAAEMENQISGEIKNDRIQKLLKVGDETAKEFFQKNVNSLTKVLIEEYDIGTKLATGYTDNYIKAYLMVDEEESTKMINEFVYGTIVKPYKDGVLIVLKED